MLVVGVVVVDVCVDFNVVGGTAAVVFCCLQKTHIHRILPCFTLIGQGGSLQAVS